MAPVLLVMACQSPGGVLLAQEAASPRLVLPEGLDPALAANIEAQVQLPRQQACDVPLARLRRLLPQTRQQLDRAAQALGYYHANHAVQVNATPDGKCWQLDVTIDPGPQVTLKQVNIQIMGYAATQGLFVPDIVGADLASGQGLHQGRYEALKSALSGRAADQGYFEARFERSEIALDLVANSADITIIFNPGPQYRFGMITFSGQGLLNPDLVRDKIGVQQGEPYSTERLAQLRANLDASQFFRDIRVVPDLQQGGSQQIPVDIVLQLRPRHAWTGGVGFSTDIGPQARLSYQNRYVNSRGHTLSADASFSPVRSQINGAYNIPLPGNDPTRKLVLSSGYTMEDASTYISKRLLTAATVTDQTASGWRRSIFLELQRDAYEVGTERQTSVLLMPGASLAKTSADDLINPRQGWKLFTSVRAASDTVLSDATMVQLYASAKYIRSLGDLRLLTRVESGTTWINDVENLPASLRYFTGGDQSIRGYGFRKLGPLGPDDVTVVGGRNLLVGSVEFDYLVKDSWRVAVFSDAGNAFNNPNDFEFKRSAGIGVRWLSPVGPIRIDIAHPYNSEESFRLHITMGPDL
jgi:translocation and assembly module TamA